MKEVPKEINLKGHGVSQGIAIGPAYFLPPVDLYHTESRKTEENVQQELFRFKQALNHSRTDLQQIRQQLEVENAKEAVDILDAQLQLIDDPLIAQEVEFELCETGRSAPYVFQRVIKNVEERFRSFPDPTMRERFKDVEDIAKRVLRHLRPEGGPRLAQIPHDAIVFTTELLASDIAEVKTGCIGAFVTKLGGATSHAAIVAKARGIPLVTHVNPIALSHLSQQLVIVDGHNGNIILNPSLETVNHYQALRQQQIEQQEKLHRQATCHAETYDGHDVRLSANLEGESDVDMLHFYGSSGVGLFRSEYLYLAANRFPDEDEQFQVYRQIVTRMAGLPVVIRAFDIGGDKSTDYNNHMQEANPYLGWRAIRFLLAEQGIFRTQLRALLRASAYGDVGIMFPLVTGLQELLEAKHILKETEQQLRSEGQTIGARIRVGCMIEVPSAAIISDLLAKECDFLSIGTNDLVQYALAVDRGNPALSSHFTPTHPSVLRLIKLVVSEAAYHHIPVTVCGEVAADPHFTALLLGLGVNELSVAARHIPIIKNAIRRSSIVDSIKLAEKALSLSTSDEIHALLEREYASHHESTAALSIASVSP